MNCNTTHYRANSSSVPGDPTAKLKGRSPQCVSNWIGDGKISPAAMVGEGHRAQIWVEQADADLARSLDPAQQAAQEHPIVGAIMRSVDAPPAAEAAASNVVPLRRPGMEDDEDLRRRRKADADKAEYDAEAAKRKLAVEEGRWIDAAVAQKTWAAELAHALSDIETFLTGTLARKIADEHHLDWKPLAAMMRDEFRDHRQSVSTAAEKAVKLIEDATAEAAE